MYKTTTLDGIASAHIGYGPGAFNTVAGTVGVAR